MSCHGASALYKVGAGVLLGVLVIVPIAVAILLARRMLARTETT
jgi:hypothetical protein